MVFSEEKKHKFKMQVLHPHSPSSIFSQYLTSLRIHHIHAHIHRQTGGILMDQQKNIRKRKI